MEDLITLTVRAMESSEAANQRFLGVGDFLWMSEMAAILREHFGARAMKVPTRPLPDFIVRLAAVFQHEARFMAPVLGIRREFDAVKAGSLLHWHPRPSRDAVIDCAESMLNYGLI